MAPPGDEVGPVYHELPRFALGPLRGGLGLLLTHQFQCDGRSRLWGGLRDDFPRAFRQRVGRHLSLTQGKNRETECPRGTGETWTEILHKEKEAPSCPRTLSIARSQAAK